MVVALVLITSSAAYITSAAPMETVPAKDEPNGLALAVTPALPGAIGKIAEPEVDFELNVYIGSENIKNGRLQGQTKTVNDKNSAIHIITESEIGEVTGSLRKIQPLKEILTKMGPFQKFSLKEMLNRNLSNEHTLHNVPQGVAKPRAPEEGYHGETQHKPTGEGQSTAKDDAESDNRAAEKATKIRLSLLRLAAWMLEKAAEAPIIAATIILSAIIIFFDRNAGFAILDAFVSIAIESILTLVDLIGWILTTIYSSLSSLSGLIISKFQLYLETKPLTQVDLDNILMRSFAIVGLYIIDCQWTALSTAIFNVVVVSSINQIVKTKACSGITSTLLLLYTVIFPALKIILPL